jgi:hypothetical protein
MALRFCILKEFGDTLDEGEPYFLGTTPTLEAARRGVEALAEFWPGRYIIYNEHTGDRIAICASAESNRTSTRPLSPPLMK